MVILITGASGGLGSAVVPAFLESGAAAVFGVARSWDRPLHADGRFHAITADLASAAECARIVERTGPVDALVHLVGAFDGGKPVEGTPDAEWRQMLDVNLTTAFYLFRAVLPGMKAAKRGRILAIGSKAALDPVPNFSAYSVAKAGLIALVKTLALEVRDDGITANVVLPGVIDTTANRKAMPKADFSAWVKPEAIANTLVWLASAQAAEVNGAAIPMYGRI